MVGIIIVLSILVTMLGRGDSENSNRLAMTERERRIDNAVSSREADIFQKTLDKVGIEPTTSEMHAACLTQKIWGFPTDPDYIYNIEAIDLMLSVQTKMNVSSFRQGVILGAMEVLSTTRREDFCLQYIP